MLLATIDSFLGSLWFAGLAAIVGYTAGHLFPFNTVVGLIFKKK